jgi:hypothetical protein
MIKKLLFLAILTTCISFSDVNPPKAKHFCLTTCEASVYSKPDLKSQVFTRLPKGEKLEFDKSNVSGEFVRIKSEQFLHKAQFVVIKESPRYLKMEEIDKDYINNLNLSDKGGLSINELKGGFFELTHADTITFEELILENGK